MKLGRARSVLAAHNDPQAFADAIANWRRRGRAKGGYGSWSRRSIRWTATSRRSMHSPEIAAQHDAMLVLDEAHATAVHGLGARHRRASRRARTSFRCTPAARGRCGRRAGYRCETDHRSAYQPGARLRLSISPSPLMAVAVSAALERMLDADGARVRLVELIDWCCAAYFRAARHSCTEKSDFTCAYR